MAYAVTFDPGPCVGLVTGSGHVTGDQLIEACRELVSSEGWEPGCDEVWDLTTAAAVDVSPDGLDRLVESAHGMADKLGGGRCVFVATRESVRPLLLLFERLTRDLDRTYHTVASRAEAEAFLGLGAGALGELA